MIVKVILMFVLEYSIFCLHTTNCYIHNDIRAVVMLVNVKNHEYQCLTKEGGGIRLHW